MHVEIIHSASGVSGVGGAQRLRGVERPWRTADFTESSVVSSVLPFGQGCTRWPPSGQPVACARSTVPGSQHQSLEGGVYLLDLGALRAEHGQAFERINSLSETWQALSQFGLKSSIHSHQARIWLVRVGQQSPQTQQRSGEEAKLAYGTSSLRTRDVFDGDWRHGPEERQLVVERRQALRCGQRGLRHD
jgi:hypothetical protein